jgi:hypothetical protein
MKPRNEPRARTQPGEEGGGRDMYLAGPARDAAPHGRPARTRPRLQPRIQGLGRCGRLPDRMVLAAHQDDVILTVLFAVGKAHIMVRVAQVPE